MQLATDVEGLRLVLATTIAALRLRVPDDGSVLSGTGTDREYRVAAATHGSQTGSSYPGGSAWISRGGPPSIETKTTRAVLRFWSMIATHWPSGDQLA